jgi:hypothetical protein
MTNKIFAALFLVMLVSIAWGVVANARLLRYLRKNHGPVWDALGQPVWFWNDSIRNSWLSARFYMTRAYNKIGDLVAARLGRQAFISSILSCVLLVSIFVVGFFMRPLLAH